MCHHKMMSVSPTRCCLRSAALTRPAWCAPPKDVDSSTLRPLAIVPSTPGRRRSSRPVLGARRSGDGVGEEAALPLPLRRLAGLSLCLHLAPLQGLVARLASTDGEEARPSAEARGGSAAGGGRRLPSRLGGERKEGRASRTRLRRRVAWEGPQGAATRRELA